MKSKVLVTQWIPDEIKETFKETLDFTHPSKEKGFFSKEEIINNIADFEVLFTISSKVNKEIIDAGKNLKAIGNLGVGYDNIDVEHASKKNIAVINTPNTVTEATAELAIALLASSMRNVSYYDKIMKEGKWERSAFDDSATEIFGHSLGIIGLGRIGKSIAVKAQALGMKIYYHNTRKLSDEIEKSLNVEYMTLDEIFEKCDCISLNMPYTPESHHLVDEKRFAQMKKGSYLINVARGPIVKESALVEALNNGTLKGAGLDVFEFEPKVSKELLACSNVVVTPHVGTQTYGVRINMSVEALNGISAILRKEKPYNLVNTEIQI